MHLHFEQALVVMQHAHVLHPIKLACLLGMKHPSFWPSVHPVLDASSIPQFYLLSSISRTD